jgi:hypothetical protein
MSLNVEINKKLVAVILAIGSLTITLLGFITNEYLSEFKSTSSDVLDLKTEVVLMKQKIDDDKSQWLTLKQQDDRIKNQEVEIRVLKIMMEKMSSTQCNEIIVRVDEGTNGKTSKVVHPEVVRPEVVDPDPIAPIIPPPTKPIIIAEPPTIVNDPPDGSPPPPALPELLSEEEIRLKAMEEALEEKQRMEDRIKDLERQKDYEDYRREQMIQQRIFPNQRNSKR